MPWMQSSMPRSLDTVTGGFVWKDNVEDVVYAIPSYTWTRRPEGEQSYADVLKLQAEVDAYKKLHPPTTLSATTPTPLSQAASSDIADALPGLTIFSHPRLSAKIKGICKVSRAAGYRLVCNDACCIDKSSSAELSGTINSMFKLYQFADMCYIYLADVPEGDFPDAPHSRFRKSRWHTRGWTLQEVLAPRRAVFLTQ